MFLTSWFRTPKRVGFEDMIYAVQHPDQFIVINTLSANEQECLIQTTVAIDAEETAVNTLLTQYDSRKIILYGKHSADTTVDIKHTQLLGLGIGDVYIYSGGLFEWVLLQDVYGNDEFPTTKRVVDILRFKPPAVILDK